MSDFDHTKIRRLDGGLLLVFHHLLRLRRATQVGALLGLSPSAISHALTRLRDLYEDPLFIRRPHGLEPTARALELGPRIEALLEIANEGLGQEPAFDPRSSRRWFVMAAPEFVAALIGGRLTRTLGEVAPNLGYALETRNPDAALEALRRGQIDLAVGRFPRMRPGVSAEVLFEDDYCVIARRGHPRIEGALRPGDLIREKFAFASAESEVGEDIDNDLSDLRIQATTPSWLNVLLMVAATDSLGALPRRLAQSQADLLGLQVLDPPDEAKRRFQVVAVRREGRPDEGLDWFLARVREAAA